METSGPSGVASLNVKIVAVDPADEQLLAAWHAAYAEAELADRPLGIAWQLPEMRVTLANRESRKRVQAWAGVVDDVVVCAGYVDLPLLDNTSLCTIHVTTPPAFRRQGHGSAMLAHITDFVTDLGRSTVLLEITWPYDVGPSGRGAPGVEFALRHGFACALAEVGRVLMLPVEEGLLARLAREAAAHHGGYRIETAIGPVPAEWIEDWVVLESHVMTDAPTGDLELEAEVADPAVRREVEATSAAQGRTHHLAVALGGDDRVVAYTELVTTVHEPERVYQWGTLVAPEHRGHRLGLAIKAANLLALPEGPAR